MENKELEKEMFDYGIFCLYATAGAYFVLALLNTLLAISPDLMRFIARITLFEIGDKLQILFPTLHLTCAITTFLITKYGLKEGLIHNWIIMLVMVTLIPVNLVIFQLSNQIIPVSFFLVVFGIPGVALTGPYTFSMAKENK